MDYLEEARAWMRDDVTRGTLIEPATMGQANATIALAEQQKRTADALERIVAIMEASTREGELYIHTHAR